MRNLSRVETALAVSVVAMAAMVGACGGEQSTPPPVAPVAPPAPAPVASATPAADAPAPAPEAFDAGPPAPTVAQLTSKPVPFAGATAPVSFDYLAADRANGKVWVPISNAGTVYVLDVATLTFAKVDGFKTTEREMHGKKRTVGPSAVAVGDGTAYVGNRATSEVCAVAAKTLKKGPCVKIASPTDGVAYVASAKEVWVTTPRDQSITVLDAAHGLKVKAVVKTDGATEGYGADESHGRFFTNLEDKGGTVVIDVGSHKVTATWNAGCGSDGPRGLAVDPARGFVIVACTDHVQVLDGGHDGAKLGSLDTGLGVDNIDYLPEKALLVVGAGKAAKVTVAHLGDDGKLTTVATGATVAGARNAVADADGNVYVVDPQGGQLLVLKAP
jgi:hypothetical protein